MTYMEQFEVLKKYGRNGQFWKKLKFLNFNAESNTALNI